MLMKAHESLYTPLQDGLQFPREPAFASLAEQRAHRKQRLAAACRIFGRQGFGHGFGGHLTVRDPEHADLFWTNPMCVPFSRVKTSMLILADHEGRVVEGNYAINRAGYVLHAAIHGENPDIVASCHAHTVAGGAWSAIGREFEPFNQDACAFYGDHMVLAAGAGKVPIASDSGHPVADAFGKVKAVIHQNHGLLTASRHSIDDAVWNFIAFDHCCRMALQIEATGIKPYLVDPEHAAYTHQQIGNGYIGWLHFQTLYMEIFELEPEFLN